MVGAPAPLGINSCQPLIATHFTDRKPEDMNLPKASQPE